MKAHYKVQKKERFPQDEVLDMCERIAGEGITVDKEQYDGTRKTYECDAFPLEYDGEGDWVWVSSNLRKNPEVRECLKAIGFRFAGPKSKHPNQWGNSCLKPTRVRPKGKKKNSPKIKEDDDKPRRSDLANNNPQPKPNPGVSDMLRRLRQLKG